MTSCLGSFRPTDWRGTPAQLILAGGAPGVADAEGDEHRHDDGEGEGGDRAPEHHFADGREGVRLEQQPPQGRALEGGLLQFAASCLSARFARAAVLTFA